MEFLLDIIASLIYIPVFLSGVLLIVIFSHPRTWHESGFDFGLFLSTILIGSLMILYSIISWIGIF